MRGCVGRRKMSKARKLAVTLETVILVFLGKAEEKE